LTPKEFDNKEGDKQDAKKKIECFIRHHDKSPSTKNGAFLVFVWSGQFSGLSS
jgi:hypothetical protein